MSRRQERNTLYARALKIGLGISVAAHAAVFGFGHFGAPSPASRADLTAITMAEPERAPERAPPPEPEVTPTATATPIASRPAGVIVPTPADVPTLLDLTESTAVARASTQRPIPPLVPRPRISAVMSEQGVAPVTVDVPTWMLADGKAGTVRAGNGGRGIQIGVVGGGRGGTCKPVPGGWRIGSR